LQEKNTPCLNKIYMKLYWIKGEIMFLLFLMMFSGVVAIDSKDGSKKDSAECGSEKRFAFNNKDYDEIVVVGNKGAISMMPIKPISNELLDQVVIVFLDNVKDAQAYIKDRKLHINWQNNLVNIFLFLKSPEDVLKYDKVNIYLKEGIVEIAMLDATIKVERGVVYCLHAYGIVNVTKGECVQVYSNILTDVNNRRRFF